MPSNSPPLLSRLRTLVLSFFPPAITLFSLALLSSVPPVHLTRFHSITVHLACKRGAFLKRHPSSSGIMNELIRWRGVVEVLVTRGKPWAWPEPSLMTLEKRPALMSLTPRITLLSCEPMHWCLFEFNEMPDEDRFLIERGLGVLWEPFPVNKCEFQFGGFRKSSLFSQTSTFF